MYLGNAQGTIALTRVDGGVFDLFALDLAEFPNGNGMGGARPADGPFSIAFTGYRSDGRTVAAVRVADRGAFDSVLPTGAAGRRVGRAPRRRRSFIASPCR
jgi:hypothetical protein